MTRKQIFEEAEIYCLLTNNITDSWHKVLKWKGVSQAEVSRRTNISERTIGLIINGERKGDIDTVVLMCLAIHIPFEISEHLLRLSGHVLMMSNEDHVVYNYLLRHKYSESLPEMREFLREIGADAYNKFPSATRNNER